jgi:hypothetical protein
MSMTPNEEELIYAAAREQRDAGNLRIPILFDPVALVVIVGHLHLAARHPENANSGTAEAALKIAAQMIEKLRAEGFPNTAAMLEYGNEHWHASRGQSR